MGNNCGSILIVDDDPGFRELVSVLCDRADYECVEAETREGALAAARSKRPDVVLLDVKLGETSGYQICSDLRVEFGNQLPIIFVSGARTEAGDRVAGLLIGADDYVTKPVDPDELLARVARALERSSTQPTESVASSLTSRELDVLVLLAEGLGTDAIAARLFISPKTVSTHVQRILVKLGVRNRAEAVAFAYRDGILDVVAHALPSAG